MKHGRILAVLDIDLFTNISFEIIENMVEYFKTNRCELEFDSLFIGPLLNKTNN